jgi:predicted O-methyltransferase YrrM
MTYEFAYNLLLESYKNLHGWCSEEKSKYLFDLVINIKPDLIVEIGVYRGRSLASFSAASLVHNCEVIGIDAYNFDCLVNESYTSEEDLEYSKNLFTTEFNRLGLPFILVNKPSEIAINDEIFLNKKIDILHIDGSHNESHVLLDVNLWLPKLKVNGILIFDDANYQSTQLAQKIALEKCIHIEYIECNKTRILKKINE